MPATTVKIEEKLLGEIRRFKPKEQSLSAFVREAVERDLVRRKLRMAAGAYTKFMQDNPEERNDADAWERAPLGSKPRERR